MDVYVYPILKVQVQTHMHYGNGSNFENIGYVLDKMFPSSGKGWVGGGT